jgi:peroxiredoxin
MAATPSTMMPLGTMAPNFKLPDTVSGKIYSLTDQPSNKGTLIMFICNHCKYVKHIHHELVKISNQAVEKGLSVVAISSNDVINYPEDDPALMKSQAIQHGYRFPYLYDESQTVAKAYDAACTPDFFLFDGNLKLVYRGQFDASRPSLDTPVTGKDLKDAIEALLDGKEISQAQVPSLGCNIKWKS